MDRVERAEEWVELTEEVVTETLWTLESYYKVPTYGNSAKTHGTIELTGRLGRLARPVVAGAASLCIVACRFR